MVRREPSLVRDPERGCDLHFLKGRDATVSMASYPRLILDVLAPLSILGAIRIFTSRPIDRATWVVLAMAGADYAFFGFVNPTAWATTISERCRSSRSWPESARFG
jgi:hypothetical protein